MQVTRTFEKIAEALADKPRYIDNRGGARSGKTFAEMQLIALLASQDKRPTITSVVSENLPHLKRGAIRDFKAAMYADGQWDDNRWNKSDFIYTFPSGSIVEFFGADVPGKLQGPARDRLIINEANRVEWEAARQLMVRTAGIVIYDYNPSAPFWGTDEIPRRDRYALVHTTYKDNQFLPDEVRREIEANKDSGNWWRVYGLGLIGQIEGQIFEFKLVDQMPDPAGFIETYGMDFGFTNDPTTLVRCLSHTGRREIYVDQLLWQTGMKNPDIADALKGFGIQRPGNGPVVWADCAEPKSIAEVAGYGLNVKACDKRTQVREQIQALQAWTIYVTKRSADLITEGRKYLFKQRPDGTYTNEPIEFFNHGIDALRYATYSGVISMAGRGKYNISIGGR
jgi:phage terminase large subunit